MILRCFRKYIKRKKQAERIKAQKEDAEKFAMEEKMNQIEEERHRLEKLRQEQQLELKRLDDEENNYNTDFDFSDHHGLPEMSEANDPEFMKNYVTPGNPDLDNSEYKYDDDAFKEDLDGLSDKIDDEEIAEFQNRIQELENQVQNLENEKDEFERKYLKEFNNRQYLENQIQDYEQKITELKDK